MHAPVLAEIDGRPFETPVDAKTTLVPKPEWYSTESQRLGIQRLNQVADAFIRAGRIPQTCFRPALKCMILGGTGCGKTSMARHFAQSRQWPFLALDSGSWIPEGAYSKPTSLRVLRDFVRTNNDGCILIDELCKLLPRGEGRSGTSWSLGIFAEVLSFLDGDERLWAHDWSHEDLIKLRRSFFILGGGAFQDALMEVRRGRKRGSLGFSDPGPARPLSHAQEISKSGHLPDEIFSRFHPEHIILEAPTKEDFVRGIERIHLDLGVERQRPMADLIEEAQAGLGGARWFEAYVTQLLIDHPGIVSGPEEPREVAKTTGYDFFFASTHHYARQASGSGFALRGILMQLTAEVEIHRHAIENSSPEARDYFLKATPHDLLAVLARTLKSTTLIGDIAPNDSEDWCRLREWRAKAQEGLSHFPRELSRFGLLHLFIRGWNHASHLIEVRNKLSSLISAGKFE